MSDTKKFTVKNYFHAHQDLFNKIDFDQIEFAIQLIKSKYKSTNALKSIKLNL